MKSKRKVLIITYYWSPAGGPGVQRWLKFVKYLRDFGIEPIVFIPEKANYPLIDQEIGQDIPKDIEIIRYPIWEPYRLAALFSKKKTEKISSGIIPRKKVGFVDKTMLWIRGNLFIPDARKFWVKPSVNYLTQYIKNNDIQTIITTSPPHSVQLIGYYLKKQIPNIQWISDFRDPWTSIGYHKDLRLTSWAAKRHKQWEKQVLNMADQIVVTSFKTQEEFARLTNRPITVITNGYDVQNQPKAKVSDRFLISHIGSLLSDRNPKLLWKVLSDLIQENTDFARHFQLCLAGKISDDVIADIKKYHLSNYLINLGYISHNDSIELQQKSQILLLLEIDSEETQGIIPGKLFEYMAAQRPIFAVGPEHWDAAKIIQQTNTGIFIAYQDEFKMKNTLLQWFSQYQNQGLKTYPIGLAPYSRKQLTKKLAEIIKEK
ncbi:glycosyl transferase family 1 [Capnocytophaga canimorsus]|uniref:Glycosyl transferase family 1 n=1 Tax=Capnocytophaga canimorsus TaxID=28188 RepID=A0A250G425_9FLAO|nr:glycosyltransferase family 4 protein [Capnocytophaga canimorsus]ATA90937.1 glycosyl transferase family 1 [Capnocytophaga canimorsus]